MSTREPPPQGRLCEFADYARDLEFQDGKGTIIHYSLDDLFEDWPEMRDVSRQMARMTRLPALEVALAGFEESLSYMSLASYQGVEGAEWSYAVFFEHVQRIRSQGPTSLEVELPCALYVKAIQSIRFRTDIQRFRVRAEGEHRWRDVLGMFVWEPTESRLELYLFKDYDPEDPSTHLPQRQPEQDPPELAPDGISFYEPSLVVERILEWRDPSARATCSSKKRPKTHVRVGDDVPREGPCTQRGLKAPSQGTPRPRAP